MTTLECATAGCGECSEKVQSAHRLRSFDQPPVRLHESATHAESTRCKVCWDGEPGSPLLEVTSFRWCPHCARPRSGR